jgi:hypothetical protein
VKFTELETCESAPGDQCSPFACTLAMLRDENSPVSLELIMSHVGQRMSIKIEEIFSGGGRDLINLLEYSVLTINVDLMFLYLVREYRVRPSAAAAIALHDLFCCADSPARISCETGLFPKDMRLTQAISPYRAGSLDSLSVENALPRESSGHDAKAARFEAPSLPPRYIFDSLVRRINDEEGFPLIHSLASYSVALTPHENLPNGELSAAQRRFVEHIWQPIIRPTLVAAGFWRVASIA